MFFKKERKERERGESRRRRRRGTLAPLFIRVFKTDSTLAIYKIFRKTLIL
jgi:hypothetical protein